MRKEVVLCDVCEKPIKKEYQFGLKHKEYPGLHLRYYDGGGHFEEIEVCSKKCMQELFKEVLVV